MSAPRPRFTAAQRLKCFEDHGAIVLCQCSDPECDRVMYIKGCDVDHALALIDGGKHEDANFRPMSAYCHSRKSAWEHKENARAKRRAAKHSGQAREDKAKRKWPTPRPLRGRSAWPESTPPSRPFPKREKTI
jgi:5-methylcytosine-specific restriction endonuclease McrA